MTDAYISFPKLGILINTDSIAFSIGSKDIYWYGIIIALGFAVAIVAAISLAKRYGVSAETIYDIVIYGTPSAIICARLYYVIFEWESYASNPIDIIKIWNGGIAIYGAIIGAVLSTFIYCRIKKCNLPLVFDIGAVGLVIGQIFGRWGNFFNQEAFGGNTESIFGMTGNVIKERLSDMAASGINVSPDIPVHPTFLYESLWNLGVLMFMLWYRHRKKFDGEMLLIYFIGYGIGRTWIEGLRTDSLLVPGTGLAVSQLLSVALAAVALLLLMYLRKRNVEERKVES